MYNFHVVITVSDPETGKKIHRTVEVEMEHVTRPDTQKLGVQLGDQAFLAGVDLAIRLVHPDGYNPVQDASHRMVRERTHRVRGRGAVGNGHGGEA